MIFKEKGPIPRPPKTYVSWSDTRVYVKYRDGKKLRYTTVGQPVTNDTMYPNGKFKQYFPATWNKYYPEKGQALPELEVGLFALILGAGIKSGIYQILLTVLGPLNANAVMDFAMYSILYHKNACDHMADLMKRSFLFSESCHDDDWYGNLFSNVLNEGTRNRILYEWRMSCNQSGTSQSWYSADGTNFDSGMKDSEKAAFGEAKSHKNTKIISSMWLVCADGEKRGLPYMYHLDKGNRIDAKSFMRTLATLGKNDTKMAGMILDRGFCYFDVLNGLRNEGYPYVVKLKQDTVGYKYMKEKYADVIHNNYGYRVKANDETCAVVDQTFTFAKDKVKSFICLVQYTTTSFFKGLKLRDDCFIAEEEIRAKLSAGQSASVPKEISNYMQIIEVDGKRELVVDAERITHDSNLKGYSALASNIPLSAGDMVRIYTYREASEIQFSILKTQLGDRTERGHTDENVEGRALVAFVASIIRATITQVCIEKKLDTNSQIDAMNLITLVNNEDCYAPVYDLFEETKDFLAEFGIKEEHFSNFAEIANDRKNHPKRRTARVHDIPDLEEDASHKQDPKAESTSTKEKKTNSKKESQVSESMPGKDDGPDLNGQDIGTTTETASVGKNQTCDESPVPARARQTRNVIPDDAKTVAKNSGKAKKAKKAKKAESAENVENVENVENKNGTPTPKKNNRGRILGSKNRTELEKAAAWPPAHRGRPKEDERIAKEKFLKLTLEERAELNKYFPVFDDLVDIMNEPDEERRTKLEERRSASHD